MPARRHHHRLLLPRVQLQVITTMRILRRGQRQVDQQEEEVEVAENPGQLPLRLLVGGEGKGKNP